MYISPTASQRGESPSPGGKLSASAPKSTGAPSWLKCMGTREEEPRRRAVDSSSSRARAPECRQSTRSWPMCTAQTTVTASTSLQCSCTRTIVAYVNIHAPSFYRTIRDVCRQLASNRKLAVRTACCPLLNGTGPLTVDSTVRYVIITHRRNHQPLPLLSTIYVMSWTVISVHKRPG